MLGQRLHFNTYGGNPVCCAGGRAVLRAVDEDGTQANSAKVGRSACAHHWRERSGVFAWGSGPLCRRGRHAAPGHALA